MDFGLSEEQILLRDSVRKYAEAELLPNYARWDRTGEWLTQDYIDKLVNTGLLSLRLPADYGGQGASFVVSFPIHPPISEVPEAVRTEAEGGSGLPDA